MWLFLACNPGVVEFETDEPAVSVPVVDGETDATSLPSVSGNTGEDVDDDGWRTSLDCDDGDPLVHPGVEELCDPNDVDENCDGLADEETPGLVCSVEVTLSVEARPSVVDLTFLVDTSSSNSAAATAIRGLIPDLLETLAIEGIEPTLGVAGFEDYALPGLGDVGDLPFRPFHQQTTDSALIAAALEGDIVHGGGSPLDAGYEALYQLLSGVGYDQDCNGVLDVTDVSPLVPTEDDAFAGEASGWFTPTVAGTGSEGGMAFVERSLRIVLVVTNSEWRDPGQGDASPGGCSTDAGAGTVGAALTDNVRVLGAMVGMDESDPGWAQLSDLASASNAIRGDGSSAVFAWSADADLLAGEITDVIEASDLGDVTAVVVSDDAFHVDSVAPSSWSNVTFGEDLSFVLTLDGPVATGPSEGNDSVVIELQSSGGFALARLVLLVE